MSLKELEEDLAELKTISLKRPENVKWLEQQVQLLQNRIEKLMKEVPAKVPVKEEEKTQVVSSNYTTITNYSYDQQGKKVKIYLTLEGIGQQCKEEQIKATFTSDSLELKIHGYKGANYSFAVRKLNGTIQPEACKFTLKTNMLIVTLTKADSKHWEVLPYKESKFDMGPEKSKDPGAGLMDMMKKMYEEGDDNMKRTIAETWTKSQQKNMM